MLGIPGYSWDLYPGYGRVFYGPFTWVYSWVYHWVVMWSAKGGLLKSEQKMLMTVGLHCKFPCAAEEMGRELESGQGGPFVSVCRGTCSNELGFSVPWKVNSTLSLVLQGQVTPGHS